MRNHNTKWSARRVHTIGFIGRNQGYTLSFNLLYGIIGLFFLMGSVYAQREFKEYKVLPNDGALSDQFGNAVSISNSRAIIGALQNDENQVNGGAAYVYSFDGENDSWIQEAKLLSNDGAAYDEFGSAVSAFENRVAIGAPNHGGTGAVYIFEKTDSSWVQIAKLTSDDIDRGDYFGEAVSLQEGRVLVGARGDNSIYGYDQGAAYVFVLNDSTNEWIQEAKLLPLASGTIFGFGTALDLSEDRAIINCRFDRTNGNNNSSVYIFKLVDGEWVEETRLLGTNSKQGDIFGASVAIDGDLALVGAYLNDEDAPDAGAVYAYRYESETAIDSTDDHTIVSSWVEMGRIGASDAARRSFFGKTVALSGNQALIAATGFDTPNDSSAVVDAGTVYRFAFDEIDGWVELGKYTREDGASYDQLGSSVAIEGRHSVIGAVGSDINGSNSGIAYILVKPDPNTLEIEITGDKTVYLGYDPTSCTTLTVEGAPEGSTIAWSTGETTSTITACPDSAGLITYSVMVIDSLGNSATADIDVCVVDISCGEGQVYMCINLPLSEGPQTVCVSTIWVPTYLSYTGFDAKLGSCDLGSCDSEEEPADAEQENRLAREMPEVLVNAFPNPFVDQVTILFQLPESTYAVLEIYDLAGKKIAQLYDGNVEAGRTYEQTWKAKNMIPGVYIYRLQTNTEVITSKMMLAR